MPILGFRISDSGLNPIVPRLRLSDLHEAVAAALFGRFDDGAVQAFERAGGRLSDAALGDERHERRDAELGQLFDEPFLAVAFGERDADDERERQLAVDLAAFDDSQLGIGATQRFDDRVELGAAVVEERDVVADRGPHHVQQVMGFGAVEHDAAGGDRVRREEAVGHGEELSARVGYRLSRLGNRVWPIADS